MKITAIAAAMAASLSALAIAPAAAQEIQVAVPYGDINVASQAGSEILASRVRTAVDTACERPATRDLKMNAEWQNCRQAALESAASQLESKGVVAHAGNLIDKL